MTTIEVTPFIQPHKVLVEQELKNPENLLGDLDVQWKEMTIEFVESQSDDISENLYKHVVRTETVARASNSRKTAAQTEFETKMSGILLPKNHVLLVRANRPARNLPILISKIMPFSITDVLFANLSNTSDFELIRHKDKCHGFRFKISDELLSAALDPVSTTCPLFDFQFETIRVGISTIRQCPFECIALIETQTAQGKFIEWKTPNHPSARITETIAGMPIDYVQGQRCRFPDVYGQVVPITHMDTLVFAQKFKKRALTNLSALASVTADDISRDYDRALKMEGLTDDDSDIPETRTTDDAEGELHMRYETQTVSTHAKSMLSFLAHNNKEVFDLCITKAKTYESGIERTGGKANLMNWLEKIQIEKKLAFLRNGLWVKVLFIGNAPTDKLAKDVLKRWKPIQLELSIAITGYHLKQVISGVK